MVGGWWLVVGGCWLLVVGCWLLAVVVVVVAVAVVVAVVGVMNYSSLTHSLLLRLGSADIYTIVRSRCQWSGYGGLAEDNEVIVDVPQPTINTVGNQPR